MDTLWNKNAHGIDEAMFGWAYVMNMEMNEEWNKIFSIFSFFRIQFVAVF